jgi:hypothetical protein
MLDLHITQRSGQQKARWWRNGTAKGQFCDFFHEAIALLA